MQGVVAHGRGGCDTVGVLDALHALLGTWIAVEVGEGAGTAIGSARGGLGRCRWGPRVLIEHESLGIAAGDKSEGQGKRRVFHVLAGPSPRRRSLWGTG